MRNAIRQAMKLDRAGEPLEVPLEEVLNDTGGDAYFAIQHTGHTWRWDFYDGLGSLAAKGTRYYDDLLICVRAINEMKRRMGDENTPILQIT
jgi:hypothetical protein